MTFPVQKLCKVKGRTVLKKFAVEEGERNSEQETFKWGKVLLEYVRNLLD